MGVCFCFISLFCMSYVLHPFLLIVVRIVSLVGPCVTVPSVTVPSITMWACGQLF